MLENGGLLPDVNFLLLLLLLLLIFLVVRVRLLPPSSRLLSSYMGNAASRGIGQGPGVAARRAALGAAVPLSQKHVPGGKLPGAAGGGGDGVAFGGAANDGGGVDEEREGANDDANKVMSRIGQRLRGLYQRKIDLLMHDPE